VVYDKLHPLESGGLSLYTGQRTSANDADIVINQYGDMGANGIIQLSGESLEDASQRVRSGFQSSVGLEEGGVYLIRLHDGKLAKIRVDSWFGGFTLSKVSLSFVIEAEMPSSPPASAAPVPAGPSVPTPPASSVPSTPPAADLQK
jgi:hypothetical protein